MTNPQSHLLRFAAVSEFEAWAGQQDGDWELHDGVPVAMAPERADHARLKANAWQALRQGVRGAGLACEAFVDSMMVPGPGVRQFKPDVVVNCGARVTGDEQVVRSPVILVEVLSPTTAAVDTGLKLDSYFSLPTVQHYLLVSSDTQRVVHHQRWEGDRILTRILRNGLVQLDPPGITVAIEDLYQDTDLVAGQG